MRFACWAAQAAPPAECRGLPDAAAVHKDLQVVAVVVPGGLTYMRHGKRRYPDGFDKRALLYKCYLPQAVFAAVYAFSYVYRSRWRQHHKGNRTHMIK